MEKCLDGVEGALCMIDDVLIHAKDEVTHWKRVREVLKRLQEAGVTLRRKKCEFGVRKVRFLGHIVSCEVVSPDPEKVKAIWEMDPPNNKT